MKLLKAVLLPLSLFRFALFSIGLIWLAVAELLCMPLLVIPMLRRPIHWLLNYGGCSMALMGLGFWFPTASASQADHRRLKLAPPKEKRYFIFDAPRGGLVIANMQGFTDVLFLGMKLDPVFVFPAADGTPVAYSLFGALRRAGGRRLAMTPENPQTLAQILEAAKSSWSGPVVLFPEGARTNGGGVLAWKPKTFQGLESFEKPKGTSLVSLEYNKGGAYTPHHTVGTAFRHVFWLCMQPYHNVTSVWLSDSDTANAVKGKSLTEATEYLRTVLVRMIPGAVELSIGAEKHQEFMAFWDASQRKGYTKASDAKAKAKAPSKKTS